MTQAKTTQANGKKQDSIETILWQAADKLHKNIDAAEYKHVVLGLIFLKYISDVFEVLHNKLVKGEAEFQGADPEDPYEYTAEKVFFVPPIARWKNIQDNAKKTEIALENGKKVDIGGYVDEAMEAIERRNTSLKGVLPKVYARQNLDRQSLGGLIDLIGGIALGDEFSRSKDILGKVYEYFLGQFALAEGKKGDNSIHPGALSACWWKCFNLTRGASSILVAVPAGCSFKVKGSFMLIGITTGRTETTVLNSIRPTESASMDRNQTEQPGNCVK